MLGIVVTDAPSYTSGQSKKDCALLDRVHPGRALNGGLFNMRFWKGMRLLRSLMVTTLSFK